MDSNKLGKFIQELRKEKKLTQEQLGDRLGISGKAVSKWERGLSAPDISILNSLSSILGVTTTELLLGEKLNNKVDKEKISNVTFSGIQLYKHLFEKKISRIYINLTIIILTLSFIFLSLYLINNYNQCSVYNISSLNSNFSIDGIIATNQKEKRLLISKILYDDIYKGTDEELKVKSIEVSLISNDKNLWQSGYEGGELSLAQALEKVNISIKQNLANSEDIMENLKLNDIKLIIKYYDEKENVNSIDIFLNVEKEFSNNKFFYTK